MELVGSRLREQIDLAAQCVSIFGGRHAFHRLHFGNSLQTDDLDVAGVPIGGIIAALGIAAGARTVERKVGPRLADTVRSYR